MMIRLKVVAPGGASRVFEHAGQAVCIGRDPACELVLEDDEGVAASRQHARIELAPSGATLIDLGSANKTQHNEQVVEKPTRLRVGDRLQIGFTGAQLVVLDLELAPAVPPPPPAPAAKAGSDGRLLLVAGAGVAAFVVVGGALLFLGQGWHKERDLVANNGQPEVENEKDKDGKPKPAVKNGKPVENKDKDAKQPEDKEKDPPPPPPAVAAPKRPDVQAVGHYIRPKGTRPSVLLQRYSEEQPWTAVPREGEKVSTGHSLVSLPGYECVVSLESGVRLNLWGGLPVFESPVGESVVMLGIPEAGLDADIILDRGRVEVGNQKTDGACTVRLSFLREKWEVTLKGSKSRVVAELLYRLAPGTPEDVRLFGLFTQGDVVVKTPSKEMSFRTPARLAWLSSSPEEVHETKLAEPPDWWVKPPVLAKEGKLTLLFLKDWADVRFYAAKAEPDVVYTMLAAARDRANDRNDRELGLWFLAGIDEAAKLVEFLRDDEPNSAEIRVAATVCLQDWLRRNGQLRGVLAEQIHKKHSVAKGVAEQMVRLMSPLPEAKRDKAETYQELIDLLDHDDVALRHLAFWQLYQGLPERRPEAAKKIEYDPMMAKEERRAAMEKWRKLIPTGSVPPSREGKGRR